MFQANAARSTGNVRIKREPQMADHAVAKLPGQPKSRADISLTMPSGEVILIDVSVALPRSGPAAAPDAAGAGADRRVKEKMARYEAEWALNPHTKVVVAAIEVGGRWHPAMLGLIKTYLKEAHPNDSKMYVYQLKTAMQRVAVALRRSLSQTIRQLDRDAKAMGYPRVDMPADAVADGVAG